MSRSLKSLKAYLEKGGSPSPRNSTPGVVVVGSGKGGVGTSTLSALLALAGAREGRRVLLIDGDEGMGSLHLLLGLSDPGPGLGDLRGGQLTPEDLLRPLSEALWFLPGGGAGAEGTLATALGERRALFQRVASLYHEFDLVVLDGGSHLASVLAACGTGPERLLALTTQDRVAMASTHALLKVTASRLPHLPVEVVVNLAEGPSSEAVFQVVAQAAQRFLGLCPTFGGGIPQDPELQSHAQAGGSLPSLDPFSAAAEATARLHSRLASEQEGTRRSKNLVLPLSFPA